ncbi:MAG: CHAT domain-containing protein [Anaerolineae bacterium]|nr:CHAT domain-containing protein [Anaerolineae bacterium]
MDNESFVDLEIRIFAKQEDRYPVEITLAGEQEFPKGILAADILPWEPGESPTENGKRLFEKLFGDPKLRSAWDQARGRSSQRRIRLWIDTEAGELHTLPWELLQEEERGTVPLSADADTPFSRYLPITEPWGKLVESHPLKVLVAISNPGDLDLYNLTAIDTESERAILQDAVEGMEKEIQLDFLEGPVTLENLESALQKGYHVLHYIGHSAFSERKQQAALYLQNAAGDTEIVTGEQILDMLKRQKIQLRLIYLSACQSATRSATDAFIGIGPQLVSAGVPAVIAMQDIIAVKTARQLGHTFYERLANHGTVDLALNEARSMLLTAERSDATIPVLFMRNQDGRILQTENDNASVLANLPLWAKITTALVTLLIIITLATTTVSNLQQALPTPTPDPLPLITEVRIPGQYLILIANYHRQGDSEELNAGRRIYQLLQEYTTHLGKEPVLRVAWDPGVVIQTPNEAQRWGEKHQATAVVWGWYDGAGFNSFYRLIDTDNAAIPALSDLPEEYLEGQQSLRDYVRADLPTAASYLTLLGTGWVAAYQENGEAALAILQIAEEAWREVAEEEQKELQENGLGMGNLYWLQAWIYDEVIDDPARAAQEYQRAMAVEGPYVILNHYNLALKYRDLGDLENAVIHLQSFIEQAPADIDYLLPVAYLDLGNVLNELGKTEEAENAYNTGEQLDPYEPGFNYNRGRYAYKREDWQASEAYYNQSLELAPDYPLPYYGLALVHLIQGDTVIAQAEYEKAIELTPVWVEDAYDTYQEALDNLDELVNSHPELEGGAKPLREMLQAAMSATEL